MRARIVVYDDLCILDETEMLSDKKEQIKAVAENALQTTPDAQYAEVYNGQKLIFRLNLTRRGKLVQAKNLHPGWGGYREGAGWKGKGKEALVNRVVIHVNEEMYDFLDAMGNKRPEWIRQAIREKRERDQQQEEKGSQ